MGGRVDKRIMSQLKSCRVIFTLRPPGVTMTVPYVSIFIGIHQRQIIYMNLAQLYINFTL